MTATESRDTLKIAVVEPDSIFVSFEVDRNQNGEFDSRIDVAYRPQADGKVCPQYLIDDRHNTPCGGFPSAAALTDFKDEQGTRQFTLVIPKKELSIDQPSAHLAFVIRNNAERTTSNYPIERFQKAINIPFLIYQSDQANTTPSSQSQPPESSAPGASTDAGKGVGLGFGAVNQSEAYTAGGNISMPVALKTVEAKFSDEARNARYQGVVLISLIVDAQGKPQNLRVIRRLGMGLDEKALEAVRQYKFKPGLKDGKTPVPVKVTVEVAFRLSPTTSTRASAKCAGKALADALPPGSLDAINKAVKAKNYEEVIRVASQTDSGMRIASLRRNPQGKITSYTITTPAGCTVASMSLIVD